MMNVFDGTTRRTVVLPAEVTGMANVNSGLYALAIELAEHARIRVGALGEYDFEPGWYFYVGSARSNLQQRVERHRRREKLVRWHIDFLTSHQAARVVNVILLPGAAQSECELNRQVGKRIAGTVPVPGFGASDCRAGCPAHLWFAGTAGMPILFPEVVLMVGGPGAGKTHYCHTQLPDHVRVSQDEGPKRFSSLVAHFQRLLEAGAPRIVVDRTNPTRSQRDEFLRLARAAGRAVRIVYLDVPTDVCLERIRLRTGHPTLAAADAPWAIHRYQERLEEPVPAECDELVVLRG